MSAAVREAVIELLGTYRDADGYSPDDYHPDSLQHPMAEAKYLLACSEMHACGLMRDAELKEIAQESYGRLAAHQVVTDSGIGWGLGFAWGDERSDATYAITTAIAVNALHTLQRRAPHLVPPGWSHMLERAVAYLLALRLSPAGGQTLVEYSPTKSDLTYNVTAMWCGALFDALGPGHPRAGHIRDVAASLIGGRIAGGGWPYGPASARVDLVHTCYIYAGLLLALPDRAEELDLWLLEDALRFRCGPTWLDRYDIYPLGDLLSGSAPGLGRPAQISGGNGLVGFDVPARAWSIGELLVLAAAASRRPATGRYWASQLVRLARAAIDGWLPEPRARHAMHLAHGLASVLAALRAQRKDPS